MSERVKLLKIITVSAIIFLFLLVCSLIINLVQLAGVRAKEKQLQNKLTELSREISENQSTIDYLTSDEAIERYAREHLNMQNQNDKTFVGDDEE